MKYDKLGVILNNNKLFNILNCYIRGIINIFVLPIFMDK